MGSFLVAALMVALAPPSSSKPGSDLAPPTLIEAAGKPIDVEIGHAAPFYGDIDGDGLKDLLVGQFGEGKLRIYRNVGTNAEPRFDSLAWFRDGKDDGRVPTG
ncbi:MAG: hypothetical protein NVSMB9_24690 [Isosphaeraceae bacterium]